MYLLAYFNLKDSKKLMKEIEKRQEHFEDTRILDELKSSYLNLSLIHISEPTRPY